MTIQVSNLNHIAVTASANDGDTVYLPPKSVTSIDPKFEWSLPAGVKIIKRLPTPEQAKDLKKKQAQVTLGLIMQKSAQIQGGN